MNKNSNAPFLYFNTEVWLNSFTQIHHEEIEMTSSTGPATPPSYYNTESPSTSGSTIAPGGPPPDPMPVVSEGAGPSQSLPPVQNNVAYYHEYEKNIKTVLGVERFEEVRQSCSFSGDEDAKTRVEAMYKTLRTEAREVYGGKDAVFSEPHPPLSVGGIFQLNDFITRMNQNIIIFIGGINKGKAYIEQEHIRDLSLNEKARLVRAWLTQNTNIVSGIREFIVIDAKLTAIPPEIQLFSSLEILNLSENNILEIPEELFELTHIKQIDLHSNKIKIIPFNIFRVKSLSGLNLSYNNIEKIPATIANLSNLVSLALNNNRIDEIPIELGNLNRLKFLYLSHNDIFALPNEIGCLKNLQFLTIRNNRIREIPHDIDKLESLETMDLSCNPVHSLPESMASLKKLTCLYISETNIRRLSSQFANNLCLTFRIDSAQILQPPPGIRFVEEWAPTTNRTNG